MKKDFLVVGQGMAGSFLAWNLLKQGKSVTVVDQDRKECSSFAPAGMINPVTGKRLVLSERCDEFLPYSKKVFAEIENKFEEKFFQERPIIRLFQDSNEYEEWDRKRSLEHLQKYYGDFKKPGSYGPFVNDVNGSFVINEGVTCRTHKLMNAFANYFRKNNVLISEQLNYEDLRFNDLECYWKEHSYKHVLFCEGFKADKNPWFSWLPFNHAKGEILSVRLTQGQLPDAVLSCGKWCIPMGDQIYTVGSTYKWDQLNCTNTEEGATEILSSLKKYLNVSFEIINRGAGVRPIMKDLKPVMGFHPENNRVAVFNGFASKGLLWAPFYAQQMVNHLEGEGDLEEAVNVSRFRKKYFSDQKIKAG